MSEAAEITGFEAAPEAVVAAWPAEWPLAVLWSGGGEARSRWTVVARRGEQVIARTGVELRALLGRPRAQVLGHAGRAWTGWLGWVSYDAGRVIEPAAGLETGARDDRGWPLAQFVRVDDALVYDHEARAWSGVGAWRSMVNEVRERIGRSAEVKFECEWLASQMGREGYERAVERALEYIGAGDVYQVNLAHRLSGRFAGSARGLFLRLMAAAGAWYGGYVELAEGGRGCAVASASPELFLEFDGATRRVVTRPMKGTRPGSAEPSELAASEKDRAELNMIVDLMRNDLGRVCEFGSVRVERREIERHGDRGTALQGYSATAGGTGGLLQATATVAGRVREGLGIGDVLAAAFPGGSVTGAPKIRAMQIIDTLEPVKRGPYCGCFGWIGDDGSAAFNVMIRTALLSGEAAGPEGAPASVIRDGTLDYSVGAGIVADSVPAGEWEETMQKAGVMRAALHPSDRR